MSERRLILLATRYPDVSRMTRWRIEREPDFPTPVIVRGRKHYYDDEMTEWESRRRLTPKRNAAEAEAEVTS